MNILTGRLKDIISGFSRAKILVVGDIILDEFIWGKVSRISPEAPVPVVLVESESFMPGGAANVANNISAMGGKVWLAGVVGSDHRGRLLKQELTSNGVDVEGIMDDSTRPTILKTRIIAHHQQVVRVDREKLEKLDGALLNRLLRFIHKQLKNIDAVIIEDYGKGVIMPELLREILKEAKKNGVAVTVDPKEEHFSYYRGVTALTPNKFEAGGAVGIEIKDDRTLKKVGKKLLEQLRCSALLITLGEGGMCLFEKDGNITHIPTVAQEVFDVSGAGDTVIGAFTLSVASGASLKEAAYISNFAAGIVVGKLGVAVVTKDELMESINGGNRSNPCEI
jgi:D-beta-D-heptose 7-phosphate kinase/D-beta-D-heptose 1-phosphate adenosyltransferase